MTQLLWDVLRGGLRVRAAALVCELGIPQALRAGPAHVADLGGDPDTVHRCLRALASDGVFRELEPGVFEHTEASEQLAGPWGAFAQLFGGVWLDTIARLDASGRQSFDGDFWAWLAEHPRERALFDLAMEEGKERRAARLAGIEWRGDETIVDAGGGNGSFLRELLRPGQRGIVFDLPETVRDGDALAAAGVEFAEGSFFEEVPDADVYVLGTILHDWGDEEAAAILRTIARHRGARVLIVDAVVPPGNEPHGAKWLDLLMLAIAGGRERTEPEWRALVESAGLEIVSIEDGLIECRCP